MALETLKGITEIGGFEVMQERPKKEDGTVDWALFDIERKTKPIYIDQDVNMISFRIQNGPIKETGVNGCQINTLIEAAKMIIQGLNSKFPCDENKIVIEYLDQALSMLEIRKLKREVRGVEGHNLK